MTQTDLAYQAVQKIKADMAWPTTPDGQVLITLPIENVAALVREYERTDEIVGRCCRAQRRPDLGLGNAKVFPEQLQIMEGIVERLRYDMPVQELLVLMRACGSSLDTRPRFGDAVMRCVMANGADVIETLASKLDPRPWRTVGQRFRDAWAVFTERAQAIYTSGTVYDR